MGIHYFFSIIIRFLLPFCLLFSSLANAKNIRIIRDSEAETTIRILAAPIFKAAQLNPDNVQIRLVEDNSLNAFVAGGQRIFINSGLIMQTQSPEQLIGVIAHETGHIEGGHLTRVRSAMEHSSAATILSAIIGAAVTVGTGRGDLTKAIIAGGGEYARRAFMQFSRSQENAADQAALRLLDKTKHSARGLLQFMKLLRNEELLLTIGKDPYVITHPLTTERINAINAHIESSPFSDTKISRALRKKFNRMRAKITGFVQDPALTFRQYEKQDSTPSSLYARAYAHYKKSNFDKALHLIDKLIKQNPDDPYYYEFRGHILFNNGQIGKAINAYETANILAPHEPLIKIDLARIQIESGDPNLLGQAITNLKQALHKERYSASSWRLLGIAYGRKGEKGRSSLALAESAMLVGRAKEAAFHAKRATHFFPKHSPEWLKGQDILLAIQSKNQKKE